MRQHAVLLASLLTLPCLGQAAAQTTTAAVQPIAALQQGLAHNETAGGSFAARFNALAPVVDRAFDIPTILRASVGLQYASIPPAQQQRLLQVFREFTIASYVSNFSGSGDRFSIEPQTRQAGPDTVVQTAITSSGGSSTRVDYVMRAGATGYRVVDVLLDGTISRVAVERSDFRSALENGGADALISELSKKVSSLSDGQIQP